MGEVKMCGSATSHWTTSLASHRSNQSSLILWGGLEVSPATQMDMGVIR